MLSDVFEKHVPDHNYHLARMVESHRGGTISVTELDSSEWDKVCFLGPYSADSSKVLGVDWEVRDFTDVLDSDGHNVLVFVSGDAVTNFIIQNRTKGDFSNLSGSCFKHGQSLKIVGNKVVQAI